MIDVKDLRKSYGAVTAVDGVSFQAKGGQIFGLLGPNGAGKSTTIGCISGLIRPSSGQVLVNGHDVVKRPRLAKSELGIVPQDIAIYEDLPARANLRFWGATYGLSGKALDDRIDTVLAAIGLGDRAGDAPKTFSGGMKRRLNFGCGIVHQPTVLLLDEPTVGIDAQSRERLLELVEAERTRGVCVLYTTHYMEEAERLCDEIAIMDHGRIIADGSLSDLRAQMGRRDVLRFDGQFDPETVRSALGRGFGPQSGLEIVQLDPATLTLSLPGGAGAMARIYQCLDEAGAVVRETSIKQPSLETLFMQLTGKDLRE